MPCGTLTWLVFYQLAVDSYCKWTFGQMARCVPALIQAALHNFSDGSVYQLPHQISVFLEMPLALQIILAGTFKCALISEI